jgi:hypothetical protein
MDLQAFRCTLANTEPPERVGRALRAMWHAGRNQWDRAHALVQTHDDGDSCWIHAHLHRVEGDLSNARYWYARAGRRMPTGDPRTEWDEIVTSLLSGEP